MHVVLNFRTIMTFSCYQTLRKLSSLVVVDLVAVVEDRINPVRALFASLELALKPRDPEVWGHFGFQVLMELHTCVSEPMEFMFFLGSGPWFHFLESRCSDAYRRSQ